MILRALVMFMVVATPSQRREVPELVPTRQALSSFLNDDSGELVILGHLHAYESCWEVVCEHVELDKSMTEEMNDFWSVPSFDSHRLCRVNGDNKWCIQSPKDLQGHVSITDASEALRYLRCFSSPLSRRLFSEHHYVEVVDRQSPVPWFPHADYEALHAHTGVRKIGMVKEDNNTFVAIRYLLEYDTIRKAERLHVAVERLSRVGEYEITLVKTYPIEEVWEMIRIPSVGRRR